MIFPSSVTTMRTLLTNLVLSSALKLSSDAFRIALPAVRKTRFQLLVRIIHGSMSRPFKGIIVKRTSISERRRCHIGLEGEHFEHGADQLDDALDAIVDNLVIISPVYSTRS